MARKISYEKEPPVFYKGYDLNEVYSKFGQIADDLKGLEIFQSYVLGKLDPRERFKMACIAIKMFNPNRINHAIKNLRSS